MLEARLLGARRRDHGGVVYALRQHRRRQAQPLSQLGVGLVKLVRDGTLLLGGQQRFLHQVLHVEAVAPLGWGTTGGGMQLMNVAHLLQRRHLVADRGRAHAQRIAAGDRLAGHRPCRGHVLLYNDLQDRTAALTQEVAIPRRWRGRQAHALMALASKP